MIKPRTHTTNLQFGEYRGFDVRARLTPVYRNTLSSGELKLNLNELDFPITRPRTTADCLLHSFLRLNEHVSTLKSTRDIVLSSLRNDKLGPSFAKQSKQHFNISCIIDSSSFSHKIYGMLILFIDIFMGGLILEAKKTHRLVYKKIKL